ncbi:MAG: hypothetical protein JWM33_352 [Caulobacteraceae bacterium]|nr:hypothetical protein [Caulobacteraceae bacterium]
MEKEARFADPKDVHGQGEIAASITPAELVSLVAAHMVAVAAGRPEHYGRSAEPV